MANEEITEGNDDSKPDWSEGENLTGDDYVKWIRSMRGERRTIFATFIHDPQEAHAMCMQEAIDEYRFFENIEDARKDLLEELLNLYARNNQLTHENDRELKVWLAANEIWPTDKDDEALDEWPIGRQEMNGEGTIACLYEIYLN